MVASGDVDRLASLEKTKPVALRDNEKKKYGAVNARSSTAVSDKQKSERYESDDGEVEIESGPGPGPGSASGSLGSGLRSESGLESMASPLPGQESGLGSGRDFDYVGSEVGVSRTRHELARATAGIVHGLAGLQVCHHPSYLSPGLLTHYLSH